MIRYALCHVIWRMKASHRAHGESEGFRTVHHRSPPAFASCERATHRVELGAGSRLLGALDLVLQQILHLLAPQDPSPWAAPSEQARPAR